MNPLDVLGTLVGMVVPVFVAMDPVGALPLVVAWTGDLAPAERDRQLRDGLLTALAVGLVFVIGGRWLLSTLGVGVADFLVAGGLVLLVLAVSDLVVGGDMGPSRCKPASYTWAAGSSSARRTTSRVPSERRARRSRWISSRITESEATTGTARSAPGIPRS